MGLLSKFFTSATAQPIEAVFKGIDSLVTSDEEREAADLLKLKAMQEPGKLQVELNKIEASHRTAFVAGWRPALGWVCALGLLFVFVGNPVIQWVTGEPGPQMPTDIMLELVLAMLGLAGLRSFEKISGKAK